MCSFFSVFFPSYVNFGLVGVECPCAGIPGGRCSTIFNVDDDGNVHHADFSGHLNQVMRRPEKECL